MAKKKHQSTNALLRPFKKGEMRKGPSLESFCSHGKLRFDKESIFLSTERAGSGGSVLNASQNLDFTEFTSD